MLAGTWVGHHWHTCLNLTSNICVRAGDGQAIFHPVTTRPPNHRPPPKLRPLKSDAKVDLKMQDAQYPRIFSARKLGIHLQQQYVVVKFRFTFLTFEKTHIYFFLAICNQPATAAPDADAKSSVHILQLQSDHGILILKHLILIF